MRALFLSLALLSAISALPAAEPVTRTFYVSGMECGSCVYMVQQSITETKGVANVSVIQILDSYANVTFDPAVVTEQQIAQAVRGAYALHGTPYLATLKLSVEDYPKNEAKVESLFAEWKKLLKLEVVDRASGSLVVHFLPVELDKNKASPQGWSVAQWIQAAEKLGLKFKLVQEG